jgi:hypothetical protein
MVEARRFLEPGQTGPAIPLGPVPRAAAISRRREASA